MRFISSSQIVRLSPSSLRRSCSVHRWWPARLLRRRRRRTSITTTASRSPAPAPGAPLAPRLQNLGVHTFPVSTKVERAQLFMNQGLNLTYGFNHAEAGRAFAEAARLDPSLAMAYWGQALVLGPNINAPMDAGGRAEGAELMQKAMALKTEGHARASAPTSMRSRRATPASAEDRAAADRAYADAMQKLTRALSRTISMRARSTPNR